MAIEQKVMLFHGAKGTQRGIEDMIRAGWRVVAQSASSAAHIGSYRLIDTVVTFEREKP